MKASSGASNIKLFAIASIWLILVLGIASTVGQRLVANTRHYVLAALDYQTQSAVATLDGELKFRTALIRTLSNEYSIRSLAQEPSAIHIDDATKTLVSYVADHNISVCYFMDASGTVLASSNYDAPDSFVGQNYSFRGYYRDAMAGGIGRAFNVGATSRKQGLYVSHAVVVGDQTLGVVVIKDNIERLQDKLQTAQGQLMLVDSNDVILLSTDPKWVGLSVSPMAPEVRSSLRESRQYGDFRLDWSGIQLYKAGLTAHIQSGEYFYREHSLANVENHLLAFAETYPIQQTQYMAIALAALLSVAVIGTFLWIYQNRRFHARLSRSERLYRSLYESSADAFLLLDQNLGYVDCNDMALRLFGFENRFSIRHKRPHELSPPTQPNGEDSRQASARFTAHALLTGSGRFEWTHRRVDGSLLPTEVLLTRVDVDGNPILQVVLRDISERKKMEEALRQSEERYRSIFENLLDGYFLADSEGKLLFANKNLAGMLGYNAEEIIGKNLMTDFHYDPIDVSQTAEAMRQMGGRLTDYEMKMKRCDGSLAVFSSNVQFLYDKGGSVSGVEGVLRDITTRKRMEEELRLAKTRAELESARLATIISVMEEGVVFADAHDRIVEVNDYFCSFVGKPRHEVLGHSIWEFYLGDSGERLHNLLREYKDGLRTQAASVDTTINSAVVTIRAQAILRSQVYEGVLINMEDVTKLVEARIKAESASRAKSEFIANLSHEIRTPMHAIIGLTQLLGEGTLTGDQRESLQMIQASADHLLSTINDILDFSKIEAGKLDLENIQFDLRLAVKSVLGAAAARAEDKGLHFISHVSPDLPHELVGDPVRLRQVILNLLDNAIKFTQQGQIETSLELQETAVDSIVLRFSVADTGIGIPEGMLGTVFESFTQVDSSITRRFGGTGLGLAICRRLVENMGGQIWVESEEGKGSRFHFTMRFALPKLLALPVATGPSCNVHMPGPLTVSSTMATPQGMHLLLAEDNVVNQRLAIRMLEKRGYRVTVVANGAEVLKALESTCFDVILMDIQMPEMDGLEATRAIRLQERTTGAHLPIIALTAHALRGDRERCVAAGMDDYISKPIKVDELVSALEKWANSPSQESLGNQ